MQIGKRILLTFLIYHLKTLVRIKMRYFYIISFILWTNLALAAQVLVVVDGKAVTSVDIDKRIEALKLANPTLVANVEVRQQILNNLVSEELFHNEARHLKISIADEEVKNYFYSKQRESNYTDAQIKLLMNNKSLWTQVESQLLWSKLVSLVFYNKIKVSDAEIRDEQKVRKGDIREVTFKQIISKNFNPEQIKTLRDLAKDCQTLDKYAKEYNLSKPYNNTLLLSELNPEVQSIIRALPENQLSEILDLQTQKQVIMVCRKEIIDNPRDVQAIRQELSSRKINAEAQKYLAELKKRIYVEYITH
jgi:hypothetical protein